MNYLKFILLALCFQNINLMAQNKTQIRKIKFETSFTINTNETVLIDDELQLTFAGHSHKDVTKEMGLSPLLIMMHYGSLLTEKEVDKTYMITMNTPFVWRWDKYLFVVTKYKYNETMEMKVCRDNETE